MQMAGQVECKWVVKSMQLLSSRGTDSVSDISALGHYGVGVNTSINTFKPKMHQIEFIGENVDRPH